MKRDEEIIMEVGIMENNRTDAIEKEKSEVSEGKWGTASRREIYENKL